MLTCRIFAGITAERNETLPFDLPALLQSLIKFPLRHLSAQAVPCGIVAKGTPGCPSLFPVRNADILSGFQNICNYLFSRYIYSPWVMVLKTEILKYGRIRDLRIDRGLTQEDIAALLNVKQNTYCQYETGVINYPLDLVIKLAEYYGVSVDYLVGLTDEQTPYPRKRKQP
jgi:DNA-binding XRE family transcriptional regulator